MVGLRLGTYVRDTVDMSKSAATSTRTVAASSDAGAAQRSRRAEPLLMEISWEVCNQAGGIYTVLRSKVPSMVSRWGSRYCLVGPYHHASAQVEFEPCPLVGPVGQAVKQMRDAGLGAHYGR